MGKFVIFKFKKSYDELEELFYSLLTINEQEFIDRIDSEGKLIMLTHNGIEYGFIDKEVDFIRLIYFGTSDEFMNIYNIFMISGISFELEDVSEIALMDMIDVEEFFGLVVFNSIRKCLDEFISKNLNLDIVLDKINKYGINSLSIKDKSILEDVEISTYFSDYR